jgi:antitoxin (DNA-binding transcriptional repressor) of toxin-antitoxin stability system
MRHIQDELSLDGKIETITMMDLRKNPGEMIDSVMMGKVFIISKAGKPRAVISKLPGQQLAMAIDAQGKVSFQLES